jgi:amino-acid N-acetyltransferase
MSIRAAQQQDWQSIAALLAAASLPTDDLTSSSLSMFTVCEGADGVLGAVALEVRDPRNAMLRSLVVGQGLRGTGIGRSLVADVEAHARSQGIRTLYLLTDSAESFFAKLGYHCVDRALAPESIRTHAQFQTLCPASAAFMHKVLA